MAFSPPASLVFRDFITDGVPSSGKWKPKKSEIRALFLAYENLLNSQIRTGATSLTIYVSTLGNDSNAGLSGGASAKRTIQAGVEALFRNYDHLLSPPRLYVEAGTYAGFDIQGYMVGYHFFYLEGQGPGTVIIQPPSGKLVCCSLGDGSVCIFKNTKLVSTSTGQLGFYGHQNMILDLFEGNEIGAFPSGLGIANDAGPSIMNIGDNLIVSGSMSELVRLTAGGVMVAQGNKSIVFQNSPTFTNLFNANGAGSNIIFGPGRAFSGTGCTITGRALQCTPGSFISKGGNTFPSAASADGGGGYII